MPESDMPRTRRPFLVWIIFFFYLVSSVQVVMSMFFIAAGGEGLSPEQQAVIAQFSMFDRIIGYVNAAVTLVGVTLLLKLRRQAVSVLAVAFALNIFSTAVVWFKTDLAARLSDKGLLAQALGIAIFGMVVFYAWRLDRRGVLSAGR